MCFVGLGTDHVIANMYFIPLAIFLGAPKPLTVGYYIWKSMIPSLLGNIIGGGLFTGVIYWYLYLAGTDVPIHFDALPLDSMSYGGDVSLQNMATATGEVSEYRPEPKHNQIVPDSGNGAISGIGNDLHGGHFKKDKHATETSV